MAEWNALEQGSWHRLAECESSPYLNKDPKTLKTATAWTGSTSNIRQQDTSIWNLWSPGQRIIQQPFRLPSGKNNRQPWPLVVLSLFKKCRLQQTRLVCFLFFHKVWWEDQGASGIKRGRIKMMKISMNCLRWRSRYEKAEGSCKVEAVLCNMHATSPAVHEM